MTAARADILALGAPPCGIKSPTDLHVLSVAPNRDRHRTTVREKGGKRRTVGRHRGFPSMAGFRLQRSYPEGGQALLKLDKELIGGRLVEAVGIARWTSASAVRRGELGLPLQTAVSCVLRDSLLLPLLTTAFGLECRGRNRRGAHAPAMAPP
jgi:hypothetical protein